MDLKMVYSAVYLIIFPLAFVLSEQNLPCPEHLAEDITDGKSLPDGAVLKNNITYDKNNYFMKHGRTWGCTCNVNKCIQMCCGVNEVFVNKTCKKQSGPSRLNFSIFDGIRELLDVSVRNFSFINSSECPEKHVRTGGSDVNYIQRNGSLIIVEEEEYLFDVGYYCLAKNEDNTIDSIVCDPYDEEAEKEAAETRNMYAKGMIISMPFLLITFLVYAILPESNLHRKALMNYVLTLLLAYIFLVVVQLYPGKFDEVVCPLLGYMIIFFFLISFFWMNVMCLDMWFAFSGMRGFNGRRFAEKKRFLMYFAYAVGVPILHVLTVFLINRFGDAKATYYPGVGEGKCFLKDGYPNLFYFYGPMAILIAINITLFILTAVKIQKVKKETSMLKHSDSKRHSYEDDKQKFNLYVKLLFAMGINWTMEVISWAVEWKMKENVPQYVWYLTDFCNAMYGVFIFFIFVFKKKIWLSLKKRYYVCMGKPHFAHTMSVTQTTRSSNYSTTEAGHNDHRLSELKNGRGEERMLPQN